MNGIPACLARMVMCVNQSQFTSLLMLNGSPAATFSGAPVSGSTAVS